MEKVKDNMRKHIEIGQLPRYSRPIHMYSNNDDTEYMEPINTWNYNLSVLKNQREEEEKLLIK